MKKLSALAVSFVACSAFISVAANAAPIDTTAPEIATTNWTGFYFGGDIGGASQHTHGTSDFFQNNLSANAGFNNNLQRHSPSISSAIGGIHAGFNWQFARSWVIGIEGDWQPTHSRDSFCRQTDIQSQPCTDNGRGFATIGDELRLSATARGRFGWAFDQMMIYGTAGAAFAEVRTSLSLTCAGGCGNSPTGTATTAESSSHKTGWVAGAGIERMFGRNWIVRVEYMHVDLGSVSSTLSLPLAACNGPPCGLSWSQDPSYDIVRAGISYKFGGF